MKSYKLAMTALVLGATLQGAPALAGVGEGRVETVILKRGGLIKTDDLDFGIFAPGGGGTATIDPQSDVLTTSGSVTAAGGIVSSARFAGSGDPNRVVTLALNPSSSLTLTRVGGGATMRVNQFRVSVDGGPSRPLGPNHRLNATGIVDIAIGGRLTIDANQLEGLYTASFTLTMNYQ